MRSASIALALMTLGAAASADECIKTHNKVFSELGQNGGAGYQARARRSGRPAQVAEASTERDQGLSRASFERVVQARHGQLEHCFHRRLASGKAVQGDLELTVMIAADGGVLRAGVSTAQRDRSLEQCLSQVVSRWRFPRASESTVFRLPLVFDVGDLQSRR